MLWRSVLLVFLAVGVIHCAPCLESRRVPVKLFNDAFVSRKLLHSAAGDASWILESACVELLWVPCSPVSRSNMALCTAPAGALELHILSAPLTNDFRDDTMGIAILRPDSADRAAVFVSRVRETAARNADLAGVKAIMGSVMAHEIGHLLLQSNSHSSEGVMRADFRRTDLRRAAQRQLNFTPEERDIIQRNLNRGKAANLLPNNIEKFPRGALP
jgi:hypothetical protein